MVFLLPSFLARRLEASLREDISLAILVAMFGTSLFLFAKGYAETKEAQKDLGVFLEDCANRQDPDVENALRAVIQRGNFRAWEQKMLDARRKSWEARMKQNPPKK